MKFSLSAILLIGTLGIFVNATRLPTIHELLVRQYCEDCCENDCCCGDNDGSWAYSYCIGVHCGESLTFTELTWSRRLLKPEITLERTFEDVVILSPRIGHRKSDS